MTGPSTRAEFQAFAQHIREEAKLYPEADNSAKYAASFRCGNWIVKCRPTQAAVNALAARIAKGVPHGISTGKPYRPAKPSLKQSFVRKVYDDLLGADEIENALNYALAAGGEIYTTDKLTLIRQAKVEAEGFVSGHVGGRWAITHLQSGQSVGYAPVDRNSRQAANEAWAKNMRREIYGPAIERANEQARIHGCTADDRLQSLLIKYDMADALSAAA